MFLAEAMQKGKIDREKVMLASKVWKNEMGYEATKQAFQNTLNRLRTDYLDVYLIHWPRPTLSCDWKTLVLETWQAMEELYDEGRVRAIGVSNFLPQHLEVLRASSRIQPMIDQLEFHPGYTQEACVQYCKQHHIQVQAWSPIGRTRVLQEPLICELAEKYQVFPAQNLSAVCFAKRCYAITEVKFFRAYEAKSNIGFYDFTRRYVSFGYTSANRLVRRAPGF